MMTQEPPQTVKSGFHIGDTLVLLGSLALVAVLALIWFTRRPDNASPMMALPTADQLRAVHQSLMVYGFDHGGVLPGLARDGTLITNAPAERLKLMTGQGYLSDALLPRVEDGRSPVALLDLGTPGARRDAWRTDAPARAYLLSEAPQAGMDVDAWSGWLIGNDGGGAFHVQSPWVTSAYRAGDEAPVNENDHLFRASGADDAYLIAE